MTCLMLATNGPDDAEMAYGDGDGDGGGSSVGGGGGLGLMAAAAVVSRRRAKYIDFIRIFFNNFVGLQIPQWYSNFLTTVVTWGLTI